MFAVAVFAVGAGAFGPIYLHGADQTILNGVLRDAPVGNTGLTFEAQSGNGSPTRLLTAAASVPQGQKWFGNPISTDLAGLASVPGHQAFTASVVSRSGVCAHLNIVAGHCAEQNGTVVMSTRSAGELGLKVGQALVTSPARSHRVLSLTIVGLYRADNPDAPYWWGINLFAFGEGSPARPELDAIFATAQTVRTAAPASLISSMVQVPYRQGSLAVNDSRCLRILHHGVPKRRSGPRRDCGVDAGAPSALAGHFDTTHDDDHCRGHRPSARPSCRLRPVLRLGSYRRGA